MFTRRQFIVGALGATINPFAFLEKAQNYYEKTGEALIVPPKKVDQVLRVDFLYDYQIYIGDQCEEPPSMTWRQALQTYFPYPEENWVEFWGELDWNAEASPDYIFECWQRRDSPQARAFDLLDNLLPAAPERVEGVRAELDFCDGPCPGNNYKGVHAKDETTISLLQIELNRLNSGWLIEVV